MTLPAAEKSAPGLTSFAEVALTPSNTQVHIHSSEKTWDLTIMSCDSNGSIRPQCSQHKDWSIVFTKSHQCAPPSDTWLTVPMWVLTGPRLCPKHRHTNIPCFMMLFNEPETPISVPSHKGSGSHLRHRISYPMRDVNLFSRFCKAHSHHQHTDYYYLLLLSHVCIGY